MLLGSFPSRISRVELLRAMARIYVRHSLVQGRRFPGFEVVNSPYHVEFMCGVVAQLDVQVLFRGE